MVSNLWGNYCLVLGTAALAYWPSEVFICCITGFSTVRVWWDLGSLCHEFILVRLVLNWNQGEAIKLVIGSTFADSWTPILVFIYLYDLYHAAFTCFNDPAEAFQIVLILYPIKRTKGESEGSSHSEAESNFHWEVFLILIHWYNIFYVLTNTAPYIG